MIEYIIGGILLAVIVICLLSWYTPVPPSEAHVVNPGRKIYASDAKIEEQLENRKAEGIPGSTYGGGWYFRIPILRTVTVMDLTIRDITKTMETFEKDQGRYGVTFSLKYRIKDVQRSAETFTDHQTLDAMLEENVKAAVRVATVKYNVTDARSTKAAMETDIQEHIGPDLNGWGLEMSNFVIVEMHDTPDSHIISDISKRRETAINSETRQQNATRNQEARVKEAEAEQIAKNREIQKDEGIAQREQDKLQAIAIKERETRDKELDIVKVSQVKTAQIEKERAQVQAEQRKDVEKINKEQKALEGEGDRLRAEQVAKGQAASIREELLAEAEGKDKLQQALSKFKDEAIRALVAEKVVAMQQAIGVETAKSLAAADLKIFSGGQNAQQGFDLGALITSVSTSNEGAAQALMNKLARPNDLGLSDLSLKSVPAKPKKEPLTRK